MSIIDALESLDCCCQVPRDAAIELAAKDARIAELKASLKELSEFLPSPTEILAMSAEITNLKGLLTETRPHVDGSFYPDRDLLARIDYALKTVPPSQSQSVTDK